MFSRVLSFVSDDSGQVSIEWVGLTAGILLVGIAIVWNIYGNGVEPLTVDINARLESQHTEIPEVDAPDFQ